MKNGAERRFTLFSWLILILLSGLSTAVIGQGKTKIKFQADNIEYDEALGKKAKRLIGHVIFEHKGVIMYCDSAYQYPERNSLDAFGKVHIVQGDSLDMYCDSLHYDGESEIFNCKNNVVLDNKNIHLETDYLIYDRLKDLGYYLGGGEITNREDESILTSLRGYYYTQRDQFYFKKDVHYVHPEFEIFADTLLYNAEQKQTDFAGPTDIYADSSHIFCEDGFFNSKTKLSEYRINASIKTGSRVIGGDTIYYNSVNKFGRILGNVDILDTAEDIRVLGHWAVLFEDRDSAVVTDRSELQQIMDGDTLFLHADTFRVFSVRHDSVEGRMLLAYHHIRFFKVDLQGKCDSLVYHFLDSAIKMYHDPILWSAENQITGKYIQLNTTSRGIETMDIEEDAFVNSLVDSIRFNQIRGKRMTGYFIKSQLDKIHVVGNGQTIYYAQDKEDKYIGVNRGESSDLIIKMKESEVNQISYINDANATFFPMDELKPEELRLKGFRWRIKLRPVSREDIFNWVD
ncbi:MAG: OstA-like protein [Vicingaceae bacterium]